jgi:hypothetical protein
VSTPDDPEKSLSFLWVDVPEEVAFGIDELRKEASSTGFFYVLEGGRRFSAVRGFIELTPKEEDRMEALSVLDWASEETYDFALMAAGSVTTIPADIRLICRPKLRDENGLFGSDTHRNYLTCLAERLVGPNAAQ